MRWIASAVMVLFLASCASLGGSTKISQLQANPAHYANKSVTVSGTVSSSWGVPLLPYKVYRVNDGTGELTVLSQGSVIPANGAKVRVRGKVSEIGMFGGKALGLHLQEESLKVSR